MRIFIVIAVLSYLLASCQTQETAALQTAQSVMELSDNINPSIYKSSWKTTQAQWKETLRTTTDEKVVAKQLMELSKQINQDEMTGRWDNVKFEWEEELAKAKTKNQVRYLVIEFEEYLNPVMKKNWEQDREQWFETIDRLR